jgi:tRNA pseudouridine32 synthase/23S rRNA pseudouridine746 synthase
MLDHLAARFPHVPRETWRERFADGRIVLCDGTTLREDSPYRQGVTVFYPKEIPDEPMPPENADIVYQDSEILVADKPHGMPVTPVGEWIERSLLTHLQRRTGLTSLAPMHRLDRDTAGLVLLSINPARRGRYHQLFAENKIRREYLAVAHIPEIPGQTHWRVETRLAAGDPWFRQRIVAGPVNAITTVELLDVKAAERTGLFRLVPETGKKHQLRVHMASLGFPIVGDPLYPKRRRVDEPLRLLARRLAFRDPLTGAQRDCVSARPFDFVQ